MLTALMPSAEDSHVEHNCAPCDGALQCDSLHQASEGGKKHTSSKLRQIKAEMPPEDTDGESIHP